MHQFIHHYAGHGCHALGPGHRRRGRGPRGCGGPPGGGSRARRGDVRTALLVLLAEEPRNGYQLMQEIEERSDGAWRPSPGSVYPTLQQLEDEGLVVTVERDGRKLLELTDLGRERLAERPETETAPWDAAKGEVGDGPRQLAHLVREVHLAAGQLIHAGDEAQMAQAREILANARRSLYRILAGDPPGDR